MFLGRVAGTVWSTVKWPQAQGLKLLLVRPYRLGDLPPGAAPVAGATASEPTDDLVVCADTLDAGPGDDVIVAFGHAARVALSEKLPPGSKPMVPIDAAVVGGRRSGGDPAVRDADLRRLVAEVTREVTTQAERGARPAAAADSRRGGRAVVTTTGKNQRGIVAQDRAGDRRRGRRHRRHLADAGVGLLHDDHHRRHRPR